MGVVAIPPLDTFQFPVSTENTHGIAIHPPASGGSHWRPAGPKWMVQL